ncbi:MAG TPA: hypothetical protein EYP30_03900 [Archaeoglobaceae archaeon]|nr:hypothetical protein [Archaeoglobaceae archaeon]
MTLFDLSSAIKELSIQLWIVRTLGDEGYFFDGRWVSEEEPTLIPFSGSLQPLVSDELVFSPAGTFEGGDMVLFVDPSVALDHKDKIRAPNGEEYRITDIIDWTALGNYKEIRLTKDIVED